MLNDWIPRPWPHLLLAVIAAVAIAGLLKFRESRLLRRRIDRLREAIQ